MNNLTPKEEKEAERSSIGGTILIVSIILIVLACFMGGGIGAGIIGVIALIGILVGLYFWATNRSKTQITDQKKLMGATAQLWVTKAQAGQRITPKEVETAVASHTGYDTYQKRQETKKIVKGALVGGIVAGDAGAVVCATIAKNKIDSEKNK